MKCLQTLLTGSKSARSDQARPTLNKNSLTKFHPSTVKKIMAHSANTNYYILRWSIFFDTCRNRIRIWIYYNSVPNSSVCIPNLRFYPFFLFFPFLSSFCFLNIFGFFPNVFSLLSSFSLPQQFQFLLFFADYTGWIGLTCIKVGLDNLISFWSHTSWTLMCRYHMSTQPVCHPTFTVYP